MYRYNVPKRAPLSFWMLDDTVPFQEYSGDNSVATKKTGTADPTKSVPLVAGAGFSSVFKAASVGQFSQNVFKQGLEDRPFALEAWVLPIPKTTTGNQQILSHDGVYDGLSINGKVLRFGTSYMTTGDAFCDYDLGEFQKAHVVGIHNKDSNELWVNGELASSVDITEAQKSDSYIAAANGQLYSGYTTSSSEIAMNGVAIYASLSGDQISQNYEAGSDVLTQDRVAPQFGGLILGLDGISSSRFINESWAIKSEFEEGLKNNVEYAEDQINPSYLNGVSLAGSWTTAVPLDVRGDTSIYGVLVQWSGEAVTVDTSLDGTTWTPANNGELTSIIPNGYNPTNKDLQIRVNFSGGLAVDPAYLESLQVIGYRNNAVNSPAARAITMSYPAAPREDHEPFLYLDSNGINLHGGTLTIGVDATADPQIARTVELWIKPLTGTPVFSFTGTKYRNGAADSTMPIGEWSLVHVVSAANITDAMTVQGDCIVGQATLYPTALTATQVNFIYKSYTGGTAVRFTEPNVVGMAEGPTPASVYTKDWSISGAG